MRRILVFLTLVFVSIKIPAQVSKIEFSIKNLKRFKWSIQYLLKMRKGLLPYKYDIIIPFLNFPSKVAFYLYKLLTRG